ncbi:MAG TPA: hypothetical protein VFW11_09665 [Cyclobacteriaceae bacterium]|nr:hypothetical protein [Cyclobacteriaceae bacterium]
MELDDLRNIWQNAERFKLKQEEEISSMLKRRSKSIITKLKWSVWFELTFTIIAGLLLLYYSFSIPDGALRWSFMAFLAIFLGYIIYYVKKIRILHRFEESKGNIKTNLEILISDLEAYLKFYEKSYSIMYPMYMVMVFLFVIIDRGMDEFIEAVANWKMILYIIFLVAIFLVSSLWFTKWYLNKLYGNQLRKLKALLNDLEEN